MKITIQSTVSGLAPEELLANLTPEQKERAKGKDLVAYTVAEEGQSKPRVIGQGHRTLIWPRAVIQKIQATLKAGTKLFNRHNADNSTNNRKSVGEVLTTFTKEIGGKLRAIAVATMEKVDSALYDICSIEAEVYEDNGVVGDVDQVTGVAVSNSRVENPAFSSAVKMATVQCFDPNLQGKPGDSSKEYKMPITLDDLSAVPIDLLKQTVQMRKMHPSQLFELRDLEDDRDFGQIVKKKTELEKTVAELTTQVEDKTKEVEKATKETVKTAVRDLFTDKLEKKFKANKITKLQKDFLEENFDPAVFDKADDEAVDTYFDDGAKAYQKYAKMFGVEKGDDDEADNQNESTEVDDLEAAFNED